jgi:hypothetical protein
MWVIVNGTELGSQFIGPFDDQEVAQQAADMLKYHNDAMEAEAPSGDPWDTQVHELVEPNGLWYSQLRIP